MQVIQHNFCEWYARKLHIKTKVSRSCQTPKYDTHSLVNGEVLMCHAFNKLLPRQVKNTVVLLTKLRMSSKYLAVCSCTIGYNLSGYKIKASRTLHVDKNSVTFCKTCLINRVVSGGFWLKSHAVFMIVSWSEGLRGWAISNSLWM